MENLPVVAVLVEALLAAGCPKPPSQEALRRFVVGAARRCGLTEYPVAVQGRAGGRPIKVWAKGGLSDGELFALSGQTLQGMLRGRADNAPRMLPEAGPVPLAAVADEVAMAAQEPVHQRGLNGGGDVAVEDLPGDAAAWSARWGRASAVDSVGVTALLRQAGAEARSAEVFADIAFEVDAGWYRARRPSGGEPYTGELLHAANMRIVRFRMFGTPLDDNQAYVDALVERHAVGLAFSTVEAMEAHLAKARTAPAAASIPLADFVIGYPTTMTWAGQHSDREQLRRVLAGAFEDALVASG